MTESHNAHRTYYRRMPIRNQEHYVLWALCIMRLWDGRQSALAAAMSVDTSGFHPWNTRSCVPANSAGARCGTEAESMGGRERQRRKGASSELQRDSLHPLHWY